jgi:predicted small secreted protein
MREYALIKDVQGISMRMVLIALLSFVLAGCGTVIAVADGVGTAAVYGAKTVINTVDAITPDIVNKK